MPITPIHACNAHGCPWTTNDVLGIRCGSSRRWHHEAQGSRQAQKRKRPSTRISDLISSLITISRNCKTWTKGHGQIDQDRGLPLYLVMSLERGTLHFGLTKVAFSDRKPCELRPFLLCSAWVCGRATSKRRPPASVSCTVLFVLRLSSRASNCCSSFCIWCVNAGGNRRRRLAARAKLFSSHSVKNDR